MQTPQPRLHGPGCVVLGMEVLKWDAQGLIKSRGTFLLAKQWAKAKFTWANWQGERGDGWRSEWGKWEWKKINTQGSVTGGGRVGGGTARMKERAVWRNEIMKMCFSFLNTPPQPPTLPLYYSMFLVLPIPAASTWCFAFPYTCNCCSSKVRWRLKFISESTRRWMRHKDEEVNRQAL